MILPEKEQGFTFLEVMAAIVIISIMSLTAVSLVKNTSGEFIKVKTIRRAYELAQVQLYSIVEDSNLAGYSGSSGAFDGKENEDFIWTSEVRYSSADGFRVLVVNVENQEVNVSAKLNYIFYKKP